MALSPPLALGRPPRVRQESGMAPSPPLAFWSLWAGRPGFVKSRAWPVTPFGLLAPLGRPPSVRKKSGMALSPPLAFWSPWAAGTAVAKQILHSPVTIYIRGEETQQTRTISKSFGALRTPVALDIVFFQAADALGCRPHALPRKPEPRATLCAILRRLCRARYSIKLDRAGCLAGKFVISYLATPQDAQSERGR